jgi:hypothetical protein
LADGISAASALARDVNEWAWKSSFDDGRASGRPWIGLERIVAGLNAVKGPYDIEGEERKQPAKLLGLFRPLPDKLQCHPGRRPRICEFHFFGGHGGDESGAEHGRAPIESERLCRSGAVVASALYLSPVAPVLPLINDGKLLALSVSTSKRAIALRQGATTTEAGLTDAAYDFWGGLYVPSKTSRDIVVRLHSETQKALQLPLVREQLAALDIETMPMSLGSSVRISGTMSRST